MSNGKGASLAVTPVRSQRQLNVSALGLQEPFISGFSALSAVALQMRPIAQSRLRTPAIALNAIITPACKALSVAESPAASQDTDEDFSPLENVLADTLLALMAASHSCGLRVSQCAASKMIGYVRPE